MALGLSGLWTSASDMKIKRPRDVCALCRAPKPLCRSHIISEFLYKPSYDAKHRLHVISTDSSQQPGFEQKGLSEPMLCAGCEGRFSRYEGHARQVLFGDLVAATNTGHGFGKVFQVDYSLFKLFVLSLIWRMDESNLEYFCSVDLGPHAEAIRAALLAETPLSEDRYPFAITAVKLKGVFREDILLQPDRIRVDNRIVYRFIARGLLFAIWITKMPPPVELAAGILKSDGRLLILEQEADQIGYLAKIFGRLADAMRTRENEAD